MKLTSWVCVAFLVLTGCGIRGPADARVSSPDARAKSEVRPIRRSEAEWRALLDPKTFYILREKGTERAFTGAYWDHHDFGLYLCAGCGLPLFHARDKYDSGTGWPSFVRPLAPENITESRDTSHFMVRTEVLCGRCGGHLGHVFDDGPPATGLRYCINSASLRFEPESPAPPKR